MIFHIRVGETLEMIGARSDEHYKITFFFQKASVLTLFRMGLFGAAYEWGVTGGGGGKKAPFLKSVTHILQR